MTLEFHLEYCVLTYSDTLVEDVACYCCIHSVAVLLLSIINELGIESWGWETILCQQHLTVNKLQFIPWVHEFCQKITSLVKEGGNNLIMAIR